MVKKVHSITSLGRSGVSDFFIQRLSALIITAYVAWLSIFYFTHTPINYALWHALFAHTAMRLFSTLTLLSLIAHAWIGIWTVLTDYVKNPLLRGSVQVVFILAFMVCLLVGIHLFWSL